MKPERKFRNITETENSRYGTVRELSPDLFPLFLNEFLLINRQITRSRKFSWENLMMILQFLAKSSAVFYTFCDDFSDSIIAFNTGSVYTGSLEDLADLNRLIYRKYHTPEEMTVSSSEDSIGKKDSSFQNLSCGQRGPRIAGRIPFLFLHPVSVFLSSRRNGEEYEGKSLFPSWYVFFENPVLRLARIYTQSRILSEVKENAGYSQGQVFRFFRTENMFASLAGNLSAEEFLLHPLVSRYLTFEKVSFFILSLCGMDFHEFDRLVADEMQETELRRYIASFLSSRQVPFRFCASELDDGHSGKDSPLPEIRILTIETVSDYSRVAELIAPSGIQSFTSLLFPHVDTMAETLHDLYEDSIRAAESVVNTVCWVDSVLFRLVCDITAGSLTEKDEKPAFLEG